MKLETYPQKMTKLHLGRVCRSRTKNTIIQTAQLTKKAIGKDLMGSNN